MTKKQELKIHVVTIMIDVGPNIVQFARRYFVRHYDPRQARAWLLDQAVDARIASQDDVISMAKAKIEPVGPFEEIAEPAAPSPQVDIESAIDAENRKNAEFLHSNGNGEPTSRFDMEAPTHE